jgi:hypothetical protein
LAILAGIAFIVNAAITLLFAGAIPVALLGRTGFFGSALLGAIIWGLVAVIWAGVAGVLRARLLADVLTLSICRRRMPKTADFTGKQFRQSHYPKPHWARNEQPVEASGEPSEHQLRGSPRVRNARLIGRPNVRAK